MAIPACPTLPSVPPPISITFPGGATLESIQGDMQSLPGADDLALTMLAQAGPALAPIKPLFDLLDAIIQIKACIEAIPDSISELSPSPILECIPGLAEKVNKLLKLIPQLSVPLMIVGSIDTIIAFITGLISTLEGLAVDAEKLADRIDQAAQIGDPALDDLLDCAQIDIDQTQAGAENALGAIATFLKLLNLFLELIGQDPIDLGATGGTPLSEAIKPLKDLIGILTTIRDAIPVP